MIDSCLPRSFGGDVIRRPRAARVGGGAMSQRGVASGAAQPGVVSGELGSARTETSTRRIRDTLDFVETLRDG